VLWGAPERQIDALGDLIDDPVGDEYLDADIGIGCLEGADQGREQRVGVLGGAASRNSPVTVDRRFEAMLSTASLISELCLACSNTSEPTSVSLRLRVDRSIKRTPSCSSRSATRRLTVDVGILRRRAASEKLFASTTLANIISEFRSVIVRPPLFDAYRIMPHTAKRREPGVPFQGHPRRTFPPLRGRQDITRVGAPPIHYPKFGKYICSLSG